MSQGVLIDEADTEDEAWELIKTTYLPLLERQRKFSGITGTFLMGVRKAPRDVRVRRGAKGARFFGSYDDQTSGGAYQILLYEED